MRVFGMFLCLFLVLLFCGTLTYIYILWNSYWMKIAKYSSFDEAVEHNRRFSPNRMNFGRQLALPQSNAEARPKKAELAEMDLPIDKLMMHVRHFKTQIISQLRSAVIEAGKSVQNEEVRNIYGVNYVGPKASKLKAEKAAAELVCSAKKSIRVSTFVKGDPFFKTQQLDEFLPEKQPEILRHGTKLGSCGVVSSAGSMLHSKLGAKIDANDYVIRFNAAPTAGFESDVGTKTSLRIINSQVVANPAYKFLDESHYSRVRLFSRSPVLIWDPSGYNASLDEWYGGGADFPFFQTYFSKRLMRPEDDVHLMHPQSLWSIWNWLQSESKWPLLPNPPSSGFLGMILAILKCKTVHVYEYVPSMRLTKRCHYYDENENLGCTIGDWHPLAAEKLLALALNEANDTDTFAQGFITIKGLPSVQDLYCSKSNLSSSLPSS